MEKGEKESKTIKSVENAILILEELRRTGQAGVTELSDRISLSKGTVHHYLATLRKQNFVEKTDDTYQLGLRALSYGGAARERERVFQIGKDGVDRLAATTGETARLVVERQGYAVTLYQSTNHDQEAVPTHLGIQEDLHSTAAGKAMLSVMNDSTVDEILERKLVRHTDNTTIEPETLRAEIEEIRSRGIAFDNEEQFDGIRCVATALATETDELLGAISVSGSVDRIDNETFYETIPQEIRNVSGVIEINTTYREWME
ncbi:IclR family transcriptional regulator [Halocatena pleomorpha]|uniref:IclR family transcriptional regulator n=1 Tax=Halocatena pleomorpha TaxID=1785090 RepID=A0A3P3R870_9EURY|nr:IclR family transcriptional regulator [Halocatena pleomorpha]RRJ29671.1 IclR family transcriptional regulator [Halocatena pleomorpha]